MDNVQPMDGLDFLSLAVTAVVSYLVLFLLTKLVGNKQISQMTMFGYLSGISVGSIAAEMVENMRFNIAFLGATLRAL